VESPGGPSASFLFSNYAEIPKMAAAALGDSEYGDNKCGDSGSEPRPAEK